MRIICGGVNILYDVVMLCVESKFAETLDEAEERFRASKQIAVNIEDCYEEVMRSRKKKYRLCAYPIHREWKKPFVLAMFDSEEKALEMFSQIAELEARGTKLIRISKENEIIVIV